MNHWIYYLFLILGLIAVILAIRKIKSRENFEDVATATDTNTTSTVTNNNGTSNTTSTTAVSKDSYLENLENVPKSEQLKFYLTSYSDKTLYGKAPYSAEEFKWYDYKSDDVSFRMIGDIPGSIRSPDSVIGLPLKKVKLIGPASHIVCGITTPAELDSFTLLFYGKVNSLVFTNNKPNILFQMFAENPNHVQWSIAEKNKDTCFIEVILGNVNKVYRWEVPKTTLISNGNPTLYALVYDKRNVSKTSINVYIGTNNYTALVANPSVVRLGNTPMEINSLTNFDFTLQAFAYINAALGSDELPVWTEYFLKEAGGIAKTMKYIQDTYSLEVMTLNQQLSMQTNSVDKLQAELDKCMAKLPAVTYEDKKNKWQISMNGSADISAADSEKCSILNLTPMWKEKDAMVNDKVSTTTSTTGTTGTAGTGTNETSGLKVVSPVVKTV